MRFYKYRDGVIVGEFALPQPSIETVELADDHPDVIAWREPPPSAADVIAERARRLALGFDYDFGDARGVHRIGTTDADMRGWDVVTKLAQARIALDSTDPIVIVTDTGPAVVTPLEWMAILNAAGAVQQPLWAASFALQAMSPIPTDYASDAYWSPHD